MTSPRVAVHRLGREREPVAVIENFAADPDAVRAAAAAGDWAAAGEHYPGIKAALPAGYLAQQRGLLATVMREVFGVSGTARVLEARFSLVTTRPERLSLHQRLPHVDAIEPGRLALIHYLVPDGTGGTAFFRHRATGFETVDGVRAPEYFAALDKDVRELGVAPGYPLGDTPAFERTGGFDGSWNRALVYRGRLLHCGEIAAGRLLSPDPMTGRLTVTGFFAVD